jgi:hypothetical protein
MNSTQDFGCSSQAQNNKRKASTENPQYLYQNGKKFRLLLVDSDDECDKEIGMLNQEVMSQLGIKKCPICKVLTQKEGSCDNVVLFCSSNVI